MNTGNNGTPQGLAKSLGISLFDFPAGAVGGHTPASSDYLAVEWTAPAAGTIDLSGSVWMWRDLGRHEALSLFVESNALISGVPIPVRSDGVTSSNPYTLAQAVVAGGGSANSLLDISVTSGETVILAARRIDTEDFVGMNFTVDFTGASSVPEPGTLVLMSLGTTFGATWLLRRCRRLSESPNCINGAGHTGTWPVRLVTPTGPDRAPA